MIKKHYRFESIEQFNELVDLENLPQFTDIIHGYLYEPRPGDLSEDEEYIPVKKAGYHVNTLGGELPNLSEFEITPKTPSYTWQGV